MDINGLIQTCKLEGLTKEETLSAIISNLSAPELDETPAELMKLVLCVIATNIIMEMIIRGGLLDDAK